jgi:phosphoribosylanthranilate isomerase
MTRIKICGITNEEDALEAAHYGVDALGFVFAPSPRRVIPGMVQEIVQLLPPFISRVGVFVNEDKEKVKKIAESSHLTTLQFHGEETPSYCLGFREKVVKAFSIRDEAILKTIPEYEVDAYLLDSYSPSRYGGTGKTFDWDIARKIKQFGVPIILSGGLNPDNVKEAIERVRPYAVDVGSGVEAREGKKDPEKLKSFVMKVRETDELFKST